MKKSLWFRFVNAIGLDDGRDGLSFNKLVTCTIAALVVHAVVARADIATNAMILALAVLFSGYGFKGIGLFSTMYRRTDTVTMTGDVARVVATSRTESTTKAPSPPEG
jgi:hypothetical protein